MRRHSLLTANQLYVHVSGSGIQILNGFIGSAEIQGGTFLLWGSSAKHHNTALALLSLSPNCVYLGRPMGSQGSLLILLALLPSGITAGQHPCVCVCVYISEIERSGSNESVKLFK